MAKGHSAIPRLREKTRRNRRRRRRREMGRWGLRGRERPRTKSSAWLAGARLRSHLLFRLELCLPQDEKAAYTRRQTWDCLIIQCAPLPQPAAQPSDQNNMGKVCTNHPAATRYDEWVSKGVDLAHSSEAAVPAQPL